MTKKTDADADVTYIIMIVIIAIVTFAVIAYTIMIGNKQKLQILEYGIKLLVGG